METNEEKEVIPGSAPIRIAQIIGEASFGGVEAVINNYYQFIDRTKYQFDFYLTSASGLIREKNIEPLGGRIFIIPDYKKDFIGFQKTLRKHFEENHYLIVHSNMNSLSYFVLKEAKKAGVPIRISHSHSTSNKKEYLRNIIKNVLRKKSKVYATDYVACSEAAGRWLFGDDIFDAGKVKVINNGIDIEKFKFNPTFRREIRDKFHIADSTFVLGHTGRMVKQKNQSFLLDVFAEYQKINSDSALLLLGEGPLQNALEKKTRELGLEGKVIFAGPHTHSQKYYSASDAFLLPSLYEGLPVVLVEAQDSGLPCYVSKFVSGEAKVLPNYRELAIDSPKEWAEAIARGGKKPDEERLKAPSYYEGRKFDLKKNAVDLAEFYDQLLAAYKKKQSLGI